MITWGQGSLYLWTSCSSTAAKGSRFRASVCETLGAADSGTCKADGISWSISDARAATKSWEGTAPSALATQGWMDTIASRNTRHSLIPKAMAALGCRPNKAGSSMLGSCVRYCLSKRPMTCWRLINERMAGHGIIWMCPRYRCKRCKCLSALVDIWYALYTSREKRGNINVLVKKRNSINLLVFKKKMEDP